MQTAIIYSVGIRFDADTDVVVCFLTFRSLSFIFIKPPSLSLSLLTLAGSWQFYFTHHLKTNLCDAEFRVSVFRDSAFGGGIFVSSYLVFVVVFVVVIAFCEKENTHIGQKQRQNRCSAALSSIDLRDRLLRSMVGLVSCPFRITFSDAQARIRMD